MRTLQICDACRRQLDTTGFESGTAVRCTCGARLVVRSMAPRSPRALRCSSCGGNLRDGARQCEYCAAEITLDERRLDSLCPGCFARLASDAHYCMDCGLAIEPQAWLALRDGAACPRCRGALRQRIVGAETLVECGSCGGLWIEAALFERLCERADQSGIVQQVLGATPQRVVDAQAVRYLPCVRCLQPMNRKNLGGTSGIILDLCKEHGWWLDHGELERALAFARAGGFMRARALEAARLQADAARGAAQASALPIGEGPALDPSKDLSLDLVAVLGFLARWCGEFLGKRAG